MELAELCSVQNFQICITHIKETVLYIIWHRWQSPAKLKMAIKGASPQASPQRKTSPVVPYGSPIGYGYGEKKSLVSPDIRTRLFSNVTE